MPTSPINSVPARHLPGDLALWFFVLAELSVFALLIAGFAVARFLDPVGFNAGPEALGLTDGVALTLCLLGAGSCVVAALEQARISRPGRAGLWLLAAQGLGWGYIVLKAQEYQHLASQGLSIDSGGFFTQYWLISGFHFVHVLLGLLVLLLLSVSLAWRRPVALSTLESAGIYWHMLDLVWVMLFALFYLLL